MVALRVAQPARWACLWTMQLAVGSSWAARGVLSHMLPDGGWWRMMVDGGTDNNVLRAPCRWVTAQTWACRLTSDE